MDLDCTGMLPLPAVANKCSVITRSQAITERSTHRTTLEPMRKSQTPEVATEGLRALLDAIRYTWLGSRRLPATKMPPKLGGYLVDTRGRRAFGETLDLAGQQLARADLEAHQRLVVSEFYGLAGFPCGLAWGKQPLVGRIWTVTVSHEDLLFGWWVQSPLQSEVFTYSTVTNVTAGYT